jgi:thymidylate kinase
MEQHMTLEIVRGFCQELKSRGIEYCHWKSNAMLDRSASGENDLDLLIGRADAHRFTCILNELGFKEAHPGSQWRHPGTMHFYGYDAESEKLVNVHVHYQLILGHDLLRDYRLAIETSYLESAHQRELFKVPAPELEFIVFVIRMILKRPLFDLKRRRSLSVSANQELLYLQSQINQQQTHAMLSAHFPSVNSRLFSDCVDSLQPDCSRWRRHKASQRLRHALRASRRYSWFMSVVLKAWHRFAGAFRVRFIKLSTRKRLVHGGALIAIVGGDGAGKSTAVQAVSRWLAEHFDTMPVHMGKPPRSWFTFVVDGVIRFSRLVTRLTGRKRRSRRSTGSSLYTSIGPLQSLRYVCTARDRYRTHVRARRFTSDGGIAICDRYPLSQIKGMDGPRLGYLEERARSLSRLARFLARLEATYYRQISAPDFLIVLRVHPDIAVRRKVDEDAESVRTRSQEIWELEWQQAYAHVVDASRSQAKVLSELKSLIWSKL